MRGKITLAIANADDNSHVVLGRGAFTNAEWKGFERIADAVLDALMDPTEEVLEASWVRTQRVDPDHRMAVLLADPKAAHLHKMLHRWRAMIRAAKDGK